MNKGLEQLKARYADRVASYYRDPDGIWVNLKPNWRIGEHDYVHAIHEMTTREVAIALFYCVPCDCGACDPE
jgi:hypothetical protein